MFLPFAKLCFLVGFDTFVLLLLSITGCFSLTYSPFYLSLHVQGFSII